MMVAMLSVSVGTAIKAAPFKDKRRNERAIVVVNDMVQGVACSEGRDKCGGGASSLVQPWAHAMASWRFFNNEALTLPALYTPCREVLRDLVPVGARCLLPFDLSPVDVSRHESKLDRVRIGNEHGLGYELATLMVLDDKGRPLGPVAQELRTAKGCLSSESEKPLRYEGHFVQAERLVEAARKHLPERDLIFILDREFDEIALARRLSDQISKFIIRAKYLARRVKLDGESVTLEEATCRAQRRVMGTVEHEGQHYEQRVAETYVVFHGPSFRGQKKGKPTKPGAPLLVRVVIVELVRAGRVLHHWVLLTNLDAKQDPALAIAQMYTWRWRIERLFYFIKVGLRMEQWHEETGEAFARRLALSSLAAMVIYQLRESSKDPDYADVIAVIAMRGGWYGKKSKPIGPIVLMRGMMRTIDSLMAIQHFGVERLLAMAEKLSKLTGLSLPGVRLPT